MLGQQEAIMKCPPTGAGANRVFSTTVSGAATSPATITTTTASDGAVIPEIGCFVTWVSDTDCYVRFGADSSMGNATSADWFLPAGVTVDWWHQGKSQGFFSVLQKATGGTLKRYRSSL